MSDVADFMNSIDGAEPRSGADAEKTMSPEQYKQRQETSTQVAHVAQTQMEKENSRPLESPRQAPRAVDRPQLVKQFVTQLRSSDFQHEWPNALEVMLELNADTADKIKHSTATAETLRQDMIRLAQTVPDLIILAKQDLQIETLRLVEAIEQRHQKLLGVQQQMNEQQQIFIAQSIQEIKTQEQQRQKLRDEQADFYLDRRAIEQAQAKGQADIDTKRAEFNSLSLFKRIFAKKA